MPELQHSWTNYSSAVACLGPLRHLCPYAVCIKVLGKFHSWITQVLVTGIYSSEWVTGHKISLTGVKDICVQCWSFSLREIAAPDFLFARQCPSSNTSPGDHDASKVWKRVPSRPYFQVVGLELMFPSAGEDQPMIQPEESCSVLEAAEGGCSLDSMQNGLHAKVSCFANFGLLNWLFHVIHLNKSSKHLGIETVDLTTIECY